MPAREADQNPHRRTRVSSYQARIERSLTDIFYEVPANGQAEREWQLTGVGHTQGYAVCELCGHNPIKRLFFIRSTSSGRELMIGSECARNYASVDLIDAYMRRLVREQNTRRTNARREEERAAYQLRRTQRDAERQAASQAWRTENADLVLWLESYAGSDSFLNSLRDSLRQYGSLTERQATAARTNMERAVSPRPENAADRAATPDQCPHIYNGTYTMDDGVHHMTFQIYTATRGALQGKRIVKRMDTYGRFTGFAFVGREGGLEIWRRFASESGQLYVKWAEFLLTVLNTRSIDDVGCDTITARTDHGSREVTIQRTRACRRCNRELTVPTSIESGIGPECARRTAAGRTTPAAQHSEAPIPMAFTTPVGHHATRRSQQAGGVRQSHQALHDTGECFCSDPTGSHQAVEREAVRPTPRAVQLQMSELQTGEVQ